MERKNIKQYAVQPSPASLISLVLVVLCFSLAGCTSGNNPETHQGKLVSLRFEHRNITEYSGEGGPEITLLATQGRLESSLADDGVNLHYRVDGGNFQVLPMWKSTSGRRFVATLPKQEKGSTVEYYIKIDHIKGKVLTFPEEAESGTFFKISIK